MRRIDRASEIGRRLEKELRDSREADEIRGAVDSVGKADFCGPTIGVQWSGRSSEEHECYAIWSWRWTPGRHERASGPTPSALLVAVRSLIRDQGLHQHSIAKASVAISEAHKSATAAVSTLRLAVGLNPERQDLADSLKAAEEALDGLAKIKEKP